MPAWLLVVKDALILYLPILLEALKELDVEARNELRETVKRAKTPEEKKDAARKVASAMFTR